MWYIRWNWYTQSIFDSEYKCINCKHESQGNKKEERCDIHSLDTIDIETHTITKGKQRQLKQVTLLLKLN